MKAKNLSSSDSIQYWEVCGKFQNMSGTDEKTAKYFHPLFYGTQAGQPVFVKEVHGNVWKTGVIDQPAKEPESYWIKFPDNSILRRTRSMIKPRAQPSYFELEAEGKEWNSTELIPPRSHHPFNSNLPAPGIPALPMDNPVPPALTRKATPSVQDNIPVSSTGASRPSISNDTKHSQMIYSLNQRNSTSKVHSFQVVSFGTLWMPVERLLLFGIVLGLI